MKKNKIIILVWMVMIIGMATLAFAGHLHLEKWYQDRWCKGAQGKTEVVLPDRARCDCVTRTHAIEFDFASKWAEAIGQSLYYSSQTGKRAGIVLIMESAKDEKYMRRLETTIKHFNLPIDVWTTGTF